MTIKYFRKVNRCINIDYIPKWNSSSSTLEPLKTSDEAWATSVVIANKAAIQVQHQFISSEL